VQDAVDAANDGDVIKVAAGVYTSVQGRPAPVGYDGPSVITQVVYISKTVTIRGGYTPDDWTTPDPENNPTTLDAQGQGRVLCITGDIGPTVEGLRITGGDSARLGGSPFGDMGGGVYIITATATIKNNRVFSNTARRNGGGLYLRQSNATLQDNIVTNNTADVYGGGLHLTYSDATLIANTIIDNTALAERGGGLRLYDSDAATVRGNTISGNTARLGGGVDLYISDATLINNIVADNRARAAGSALYIYYSSPRLLFTTIARNTGGDGSGVYVTGPGETWLVYSTVTLTNTILVSHSVGISVTEGNTVTINGVLWHDTPITVSQSVTGLVTVQNQYTGDPACVSPTNGDYHIGPGSAAIDAGMDAEVDHDIDGDPRPLGSGYDLGADEAGLIVTKGAHPDLVQPGAALTYTIRVTNHCGVPLHAAITDTLPLSVTLDEASGGTLILLGGKLAPPDGTVVLPDGRVAVVWTDVFTAPGGAWIGTIVVTVNEGYVGPLTNLVEVTTKEGAMGEGSVTVVASQRIYLPAVMREFS
jgi:uncharacterized repeat protein (TIGR01451 family)